MKNYNDVINITEEIYNHFSKISKQEARNATETWDISEARSQSGTLALNLEFVAKEIDNYSYEEISKMLYSISKAQREIFKLIW